MTDLVGLNGVNIEYCKTDKMIADYMTKSLFSGKFKTFRYLIINISDKHHHIRHHEYVEWNNMGLKGLYQN